MEGLGGLSIIIFIFLLIVGVLALLLPFFVLKIRNTIVSIDKKMDKIINLQTSFVKDFKSNLVSPKNDKSKTVIPASLLDEIEENEKTSQMSEDKIIDKIHDSYQKKKYVMCYRYCEMLIKKYPKTDYKDFVKNRVKELENLINASRKT